MTGINLSWKKTQHTHTMERKSLVEDGVFGHLSVSKKFCKSSISPIPFRKSNANRSSFYCVEWIQSIIVHTEMVPAVLAASYVVLPVRQELQSCSPSWAPQTDCRWAPQRTRTLTLQTMTESSQSSSYAGEGAQQEYCHSFLSYARWIETSFE